MNIEPNDLVNIILNGDLANSTPVPLHVGEALKKYDSNEEHYVLEHEKCDMFYTFWSRFGWDNELKRRAYMVSITAPPRVVKESKESLLEQLRLAIISNRLDEVVKIQVKIKELYPS